MEKAIATANSEVQSIKDEIARLQSAASIRVQDTEERLSSAREELEATKR